MANTDSKNFRCDPDLWTEAMEKLKAMREAGYDIDMSRALVAEVERIAYQPINDIAERLGLTKGEGPVKPYRKPFSRAGQ